MKTGLLYKPENKEKVKKELESGKAVVGIDAESLYDQLNLMEIQTDCNYQRIILELKKELMVISGRLIITPTDDTKEETPDTEVDSTKEVNTDVPHQ